MNGPQSRASDLGPNITIEGFMSAQMSSSLVSWRNSHIRCPDFNLNIDGYLGKMLVSTL